MTDPSRVMLHIQWKKISCSTTLARTLERNIKISWVTDHVVLLLWLLINIFLHKVIHTSRVWIWFCVDVSNRVSQLRWGLLLGLTHLVSFNTNATPNTKLTLTDKPPDFSHCLSNDDGTVQLLQNRSVRPVYLCHHELCEVGIGVLLCCLTFCCQIIK